MGEDWRMNNYLDHAMREFVAAGWYDDEAGKFKDKMQGEICECVEGMLKAFSKQDHSGSTAPYALELFNKLAKFQPITPLTGDDSEWGYIYDDGDGPVYQNKRDSTVFKKSNGRTYCIYGKVFWYWCRGEDGKPFKSHYTSIDSHIDVKFPWTRPDGPEYVFVPTDEFPTSTIIDKEDAE